MSNHYMTTKEVSDYLGVSMSILNKWRMKTYKVAGPPFFKLGRLVRYDRAHLDAWAEAGKVIGVEGLSDPRSR